jgi:hypothetical protein
VSDLFLMMWIDLIYDPVEHRDGRIAAWFVTMGVSVAVTTIVGLVVFVALRR